MQALGRELAEELNGGEVVALCGELGAGKTELVKGLAAGLGYHGMVTSPTFNLLHEYRGGRLVVFHFDLFRVEQAEEIVDLGWDELMEEGGVLAVEWAERYPHLLPPDALVLSIEIHPGDRRRVERAEL